MLAIAAATVREHRDQVDTRRVSRLAWSAPRHRSPTPAPDLRANGVATAALAHVTSLSDALARAERRTAWSTGLAVAVASTGSGLLAAAIPLLDASRRRPQNSSPSSPCWCWRPPSRSARPFSPPSACPLSPRRLRHVAPLLDDVAPVLPATGAET